MLGKESVVFCVSWGDGECLAWRGELTFFLFFL